MNVEISFSDHAWARLVARSDSFGMSCDEAKCFVLETLKSRNLSQRHCSKRFTTYSRYFNNGLTFYVVCKETILGSTLDIKIKTVIIEAGR